MNDWVVWGFAAWSIVAAIGTYYIKGPPSWRGKAPAVDPWQQARALVQQARIERRKQREREFNEWDAEFNRGACEHTETEEVTRFGDTEGRRMCARCGEEFPAARAKVIRMRPHRPDAVRCDCDKCNDFWFNSRGGMVR